MRILIHSVLVVAVMFIAGCSSDVDHVDQAGKSADIEDAEKYFTEDSGSE